MFSMRHSLGQTFSAIALSLCLCARAWSADETCVVVLRSGGVLHGAVTVAGDRYVVSMPNRTIDVQAQQVLLVAASIEAAYQQQRAQLPRDNNDARLRLVEWCLRYELLTQAEQELDDARAIDELDPRLPLFERRLTVAKKPKSSRSVYQTSIAIEDGKSTAELAELEALAADLPPGTVERFSRKLQPLLVNSCTAAGCHEAGGKQLYQLDRAVLHGLANRRITLRNLAATLAYVDRLSPQESELLKMARRTHGGREHAANNSRQVAQWKQLSEWTTLLAGNSAAPARFQEPRVSKRATDTLSKSHPLPSIPSTFLDRNVGPASHVIDAAENSDLAGELDEENADGRLRPPAKVRFGADLRPWQPQDEFDPEIFNRANRTSDSQGLGAP